MSIKSVINFSIPIFRWSTLSLLILLTRPLEAGQQVHGILTVVKGQVTIKSGKTGKEEKAKMGMKVYPKDSISTQKDSRAKVVMIDKNELNVSPSSQITISNYEFDPAKDNKKVLIDVIYGKVRSKVEQKYDSEENTFQVKTPSAVAGVRGTDFFTSYNQVTHASKVVTFRGEVAFGLPGPSGTIINPVSVRVGEFSANVGSTPPAPAAPMPKTELVQFDNDTKAETPTEKETPKGKESGGEKSKDDKKNDSSNKNNEGNNNEKKSPPTNSSANSTNDKRQPSSLMDPAAAGSPSNPTTPGGGPGMGTGMMRPEDLASAPNMPTFIGGGIAPPPFIPVFLPNVPITPGVICEFCREVIQDGTTHLIIKITHGN